MLSGKMAEWRNSLLFRLTVLYATLLSVLAAAGFAIFYQRVYSSFLERLDHELLEEMPVFATLASEGGREAVGDQIMVLAKGEDTDEEFYRLLDFHGNTLAETDMSPWRGASLDKLAAEAVEKGAGHVAATVDNGDGEGRTRVLAAVLGPSLVLQWGEKMEEVEEYLDEFRNLLAILIAALVVMAALSGWLLARKAVAGTEEVARTAEEIAKGTYDRRVAVRGNIREIDRLAAAFNAMLDHIRTLLESIRQINDNIAHDLRSPLTRIRGAAEMALVNKAGIEEYEEMAAGVVEECDGLVNMIETMLEITETEAGASPAKRDSFDLSALVRQAVELFRPVAEEKNIEVRPEVPPGLFFRGDKKRMQRIVANLLENAVKYTGRNGTVSISAAEESGRFSLRCADTGPGIPQDDLPHIFERFYRCDKSREKSGVGLGLSLVKAYAESMGGNVSVESAPEEGSVFTLQFSS